VPNGLAFSPDESGLYINDSRRGHIRAFDLMPNGTLAKQTDRVFVDLRGSEPGIPDGMKVDVEGNVYCGGAGGLWIMDPHGKKLGRIVHGAPATTNLAFGGDDLIEEIRFADDSPVEGEGFEPSVPLHGEVGASGACDGPAPPS
jgi:gluconolactonase